MAGPVLGICGEFFDLERSSPACSALIGPLLAGGPLLAAALLTGLALGVRAFGGGPAEPDPERPGEARQLPLGLGGAALRAGWELVDGALGLKGLPAGPA
jgi:hypothetical protein